MLYLIGIIDIDVCRVCHSRCADSVLLSYIIVTIVVPTFREYACMLLRRFAYVLLLWHDWYAVLCDVLYVMITRELRLPCVALSRAG